LIIDPTFSLATFAILEAFNFVSFTVEPTFLLLFQLSLKHFQQFRHFFATQFQRI
jgi:hypothetical protein